MIGGASSCIRTDQQRLRGNSRNEGERRGRSIYKGQSTFCRDVSVTCNRSQALKSSRHQGGRKGKFKIAPAATIQSTPLQFTATTLLSCKSHSTR